MGTYLSTPITEKGRESGESLQCPVTPLAWGVVDMQGWRKTMEDSHIAVTDIDVPAHHFHLEDDESSIKNIDAKVFAVFDGHGGPEVARFSSLYLVSVLTQQRTWKFESQPEVDADYDAQVDKNAKNSDMGRALRDAFHAIDRMVNDPNRREELVRLRAIKPEPGELRYADFIPPASPGTEDEQGPSSGAPPQSAASTDTANPLSQVAEEKMDESPSTKASISEGATEEGVGDNDNGDDDDSDGDSDSDGAVGKEEAAEFDRDMMDDEDEVTPEPPSPTTARKVSVMFQKLLNMSGSSGQSGQVVLHVDRQSIGDDEAGSSSAPADEKSTPAPADEKSTPAAANLPSLVQNGRLICNLPDHPIHAGATAIVAVIVGRTLTVANAGDSRAVLCRDGVAYPLSFDHKPLQERELNRIQKAGGFVNHFGRVNGNLNLSRSLGDLKYKQAAGLPPAEQMITAEPDILQVKLHIRDEFIVLGCDGIWDCLTNEQAVDYVRNRIDSKTPTEIGVEMLDEIISEDPRATQGIGGDNFTVLIVDLQPQSRIYREAADASPI